jgi:pyruvate/2-oxoglutarate/acetoin dehydrogenase E1 component/TPP-dependent pyruvate/acetoin dehydrogenase alpha subunit
VGKLPDLVQALQAVEPGLHAGGTVEVVASQKASRIPSIPVGGEVASSGWSVIQLVSNCTAASAAVQGGAMGAAIELLRSLYTTTRRIRAFDDRIRRGLASGELRFNYWPVEGQEAISAGVCAALEPDDRMWTTYRCAGDAIAKGVPLEALGAELLGKASGTNGGKGGAMGICAPEVGLMGATGIVGAGAPIANGLGLASQLTKDGRVTVVSFGDGATSIGAVHEAMNLAALWQLPVVFLCQNNLFGEGTPVAEYTKTERLSDRAAAYGMTGVTVDGTDAEAVYEAARAAVDRARSGGGPTFLEAVAFRLNGHYFGDPCGYVDGDALERARANEPVGRLRERLVQAGIPEADLDALDGQIDAEVDAAIGAARDAAPPEIGGLYADVYADRSDPGCLAPADRQPVPAPEGAEKDLSMAEAINQALDQALERDERVVLFGEDIADPMGGLFTCTAGLSTRHGSDRVRATPIAEQAIVGAATGAALAGLRPVAELMFFDFLGVCLDQLANHAAKLRFMSGGRSSVPLTLRTVEGSYSGAQHSQSLEAWLTHTPGLKVVCPSTPADAKGLLTACIDDDDPCVFIENMSLLLARKQRGPVPEAAYQVPLGVADVKREGSDVSVVTWGAMVHAALQAAGKLEEEGLSLEVVDLRSLVPLDLATIEASVSKTKRLIVAHSACSFGGFGAEIAALVGERCFGSLSAPIRRVAGAFTPVPRAESLVAAHTPGPSAIVRAARDLAG